MRKIVPAALERCRVRTGPNATDPSWGFVGAFIFHPERGEKTELRVIASDGRDEHGRVYEDLGGWEHVSVSTATRCPTWDEMCRIKDLFWTEDEAVLQFHPPKSEYVNNHQFCLHLWKPPYPVVLPPSILVGIKGVEIA